MTVAALLALGAVTAKFFDFRGEGSKKPVFMSDLETFRAAQETYKATAGGGSYGNVHELIKNNLLKKDNVVRMLCRPDCDPNSPDYNVWIPDGERVYYLTRNADGTRFCIRGTPVSRDEARTFDSSYRQPPTGNAPAYAIDAAGIIYAGTRDGMGCVDGDLNGSYSKGVFDSRQ